MELLAKILYRFHSDKNAVAITSYNFERDKDGSTGKDLLLVANTFRGINKLVT